MVNEAFLCDNVAVGDDANDGHGNGEVKGDNNKTTDSVPGDTIYGNQESRFGNK